jgi:predicted permease
VFSIFDAVLLRPLPFKDADRLVQIETVRGGAPGAISFRELDDISAQLRVFESIGGYVTGAQYSVAGGAGPEKAQAILITHNLFDVLGVKLLHGDSFPSEYDRTRYDAVILSHSLWKRQYGGDPSIIGTKLPIDASPYRTPAYSAFGVVPEGFDFPKQTDLYRSFYISPGFPNIQSRTTRNVVGVARLAAGVTIDHARSELDQLSRRLQWDYPDSNRGVQFKLRSLRDAYVGDLRPYVWLFGAAVGLVLLIACANVANLLLSRGLAREREVAIRTALGAARWRLIQQMLVESVTLSVAGGILGLVLAYRSLDLLLNIVRLDLPTWMKVQVDTRTLWFSFVVSIGAGILSGVAPAISRSTRQAIEAVRGMGRGGAGSTRQNRLRTALATIEIALSLMLLIGAGLMLRTSQSLLSSDIGFQAENLITFRVALPVTYPQVKTREFHRAVLASLESIPEVESAALNSNMPLVRVGQADRSLIVAEGQSGDDASRNPYINYQIVSSGYFRTTRIALLRGRPFDETDTSDGQGVVVVSNRLAQRLWPSDEAIGKRIRQGIADAPWMTVIGIADDVKHDALTDDSAFDVYMDAEQNPQLWNHYVVRTKVEPAPLVRQLREAVWSIDRSQPVFDFHPMNETVQNNAWQQRACSLLFTMFGAIAIILATGGLYGVMSYSVRQRRREIGVFMALGAHPRHIMAFVFSEALKIVVAGIVLGMSGSLVLTRFVASLLYGISPVDPAVFGGVCLLIAIVSIVATYFPARAAMRVDPLAALRDS